MNKIVGLKEPMVQSLTSSQWNKVFVGLLWAPMPFMTKLDYIKEHALNKLMVDIHLE